MCASQVEAGKYTKNRESSYEINPLKYTEYLGMHEERIKILQPSLSISSTSWGEACMILHQASKDTVLAIFSCYENGEYSKT